VASKSSVRLYISANIALAGKRDKHFRAPDGFQKSYARNDDKVETWMTGSIGFAYGWGPIQTIATMQLPLAWLLTKNIKLSNSNTTFLELMQKNVWAVQEPISFRFLLIFGLER
jgi:hypothetical protein